MVGSTSISALSRFVYRVLKGIGLAPPSSLFESTRRTLIGRGTWAETKIALLDEVAAQKKTGNPIFARKLLDRIEALGDQPSLFSNALFLGGPLPQKQASNPHDTDSRFTTTQKDALSKGQTNPLLFLLGAPGTGKSLVISELVKRHLKDQSVLFCCSTKAALDHASSHLDPDNPNLTLKTITGLIQMDQPGTFDNVVVDEAGMVSLSQVLFLTSFAKQRMIFVGDPIQLPPVSAIDNLWLSQNIFLYQAQSENLSELYVWQQQNPDIAVLLKEQFDIPDRIFNILNHFCYGGRLSTRSKGKGYISFIDSSGLSPTNTGKRSSPLNEVHARLVIESLQRVLQKQSVKPESIGVLSPFGEQVKHLQKIAKKNNLPQSIEFGTVHTFQGRLKSCLVLDMTAAGVDYTYRILSDDNQATALMNSALARCRTINDTEGRLIVIAHMDHLRRYYPDSAVMRFLSRLYFRADLLDTEEVQKYGQATATLVNLFLKNWELITNRLGSTEYPSEESVRTFIYNACDLIPRLIHLCNRIRPESFDTGSALVALEKPHAALALADLSPEAQFDPERVIRFKSAVSDLYKVIYESTMVTIPGENRNRGPDKPVYDPDADNGESYGRVRLWIRELRNYYQHDSDKPDDYRKDFSKRQRDFLFQEAIERPAPEEQQSSGNIPEDYSGVEYLRVTLFLLKEIVSYLETVRIRL